MLIGRSFDCRSDIINIPSRSFRHEKGSSTGVHSMTTTKQEWSSVDGENSSHEKLCASLSLLNFFLKGEQSSCTVFGACCALLSPQKTSSWALWHDVHLKTTTKAFMTRKTSLRDRTDSCSSWVNQASSKVSWSLYGEIQMNHEDKQQPRGRRKLGFGVGDIEVGSATDGSCMWRESCRRRKNFSPDNWLKLLFFPYRLSLRSTHCEDVISAVLVISWACSCRHLRNPAPEVVWSCYPRRHPAAMQMSPR